MDVIGTAMLQFQETRQDRMLEISINGVVDESMPVSYFFRMPGTMDGLEQYALEHSHGKILDIGAGAGCHSLALEASEHSVTPIDLSVNAVAVMKNRGLDAAHVADIHSYSGEYDTMLLLMNGLGIGRTMNGTIALLSKLRELLAPGGQIFGDSTDIRYMFDFAELNDQDPYYGEVSFGVSCEGIGSQSFPWIFIDPNALMLACEQADLNCEIIGSDDGFHYLARMTAR